MRALFFCLLLSLLVPATASADEAAAWAALRTGDVIALMRHADAPGGFGDPDGFKLEDCATQRNLSAEGRADAGRAGVAFRTRGVKPARILSSPWCRCVDTATLMDIGPVETEHAFGNPVVWTDRREALANDSRAVIRAWKGPGMLLVVTHGASIAALTGYNPGSGEIVVIDTALKEIGRNPGTELPLIWGFRTVSTNRARVLLWTDNTAAYLDAVKAAGLADRVAIDSLPRKDKPSADQLASTEAMMAGAVPAGLLPSMPKLRWVQAMSAGVEGWLALPDLPTGLTLTCARGTHTESMPENIVGSLFYVAKPYAAAAANQKSAKWVHTVAQPLTGKTLGILGLGAIGAEVARIVTALGMRVIGTKRTPGGVANVAEVLPPERTDEVLAQSDFVLLLLPATPATDNFMDAKRFAKMKPGAWLLNFGRGHTIKDADLIAAVKEKKIAGALLDVFRQEPLPASDPLWTAEGIIVLPHIGGPHPQRDRFVAKLFVDNLGRFLDGKPLKEVVDRAAGY